MTTTNSNKKIYPTYDYMIAFSISSLKSVKGSSQIAISNYITNNWSVPDKTLNTYLNRALNRMVKQNKLTKNNDSYKLTDVGEKILSSEKKSETIYFIEIFGQKFPLTKKQAKKSKYLETAFGFKRFKGNNVVKLDYTNDFKPAFDYIYSILQNRHTNINKNDVENILVLESFLNISDVLIDVKKFLNSSRLEFDNEYYNKLYNTDFPYPKEITDIIEDKIINNAVTITQIPDKLINKLGCKAVTDIVIKKNFQLRYKLQTTETALFMRSPIYWEDFTDSSNDTLMDIQDDFREKMDEFIDIDKFLNEAKLSEYSLEEVNSLVMLESNQSTSILEEGKLLKLFNFLVENEDINSLKLLDIDQVEDLVSEDVYDKYIELIK